MAVSEVRLVVQSELRQQPSLQLLDVVRCRIRGAQNGYRLNQAKTRTDDKHESRYRLRDGFCSHRAAESRNRERYSAEQSVQRALQEHHSPEGFALGAD